MRDAAPKAHFSEWRCRAVWTWRAERRHPPTLGRFFNRLPENDSAENGAWFQADVPLQDDEGWTLRVCQGHCHFHSINTKFMRSDSHHENERMFLRKELHDLA